MAVFAVATRKDILWRGVRHQIGNVYHLHASSLEAFDDTGAIDRIVELEKAMYATSVNFIEGRSWGPTDGPEGPNVMRVVKALSGSGAVTPATNWYPEMAIMCYWPLGRYGSRNRPQFLRKWHHLGYAGGRNLDGSFTAGAPQVAIQSYIDGVTAVDPAGASGPYELCTANGNHLASASSGKQYAYLEHRQIGR